MVHIKNTSYCRKYEINPINVVVIVLIVVELLLATASAHLLATHVRVIMECARLCTEDDDWWKYLFANITHIHQSINRELFWPNKTALTRENVFVCWIWWGWRIGKTAALILGSILTNSRLWKCQANSHLSIILHLKVNTVIVHLALILSILMVSLTS